MPIFQRITLVGALSLLGCGGPGRDCDRSLAQLAPQTSLLARCSPYVVAHDLSLDGVTLTVEPGVEVRFASGTSLRVGDTAPGRLIARGTDTRPITFTGDGWAGVRVFARGDGTALQNVRISGTRSAEAVRVEATEVELDHLHVTGVPHVALAVMVPRPLVALRAVTVTGAEPGELVHASLAGASVFTRQSIHLPRGGAVTLHGDLTHDLVLHALDVPYRLPQTAQIDACSADAVSLRLEAGTVLELGNGAALRLGDHRGPVTLNVEGTAEAPVHITHAGAGTGAGVFFGAGAAPPHLEGLVLEHVAPAGLTFDGAAGLGTIEAAVFRHVSGTAVHVVSARAPFERFDRNRFEAVDGPALRVPTRLAGGLGAHNAFGDRRVVLFGDASGDLALTAIGRPYDVEGPVAIDGDGAIPAAVTVAEGTELRFTAEASLRIGFASTVKVSALGTGERPIRLRAADGTWNGVALGPHAVVEFEHLQIENVNRTARPIDGAAGSSGTIEALTVAAASRGIRSCGQVKFSGVTGDRVATAIERCR